MLNIIEFKTKPTFPNPQCKKIYIYKYFFLSNLFDLTTIPGFDIKIHTTLLSPKLNKQVEQL